MPEESEIVKETNINYMKLDKKTGRFLQTPKGQKTQKMLEVEKRLGKTLEKDFEEKHLKLGWGQKKIAQSWGVPRNLVFSLNHRGGRRSWAQMLGLKVRRFSAKPPTIRNKKQTCEICGKHDVTFDKAHWIARRDGGDATTSNILLLCPNCHRKLDRDNKKITEQAREILLFREVKKLTEGKTSNAVLRRKLFELSEQIIHRRK